MSSKGKPAATKPVVAPVVKVAKAVVKPIGYDPHSLKAPDCFGNWINGNAICRCCRYHVTCKKAK